MYRITKGIHIHFGHVVQGHSGLCLGPHGHTWYFEVTLESPRLDGEGFVCDFSTLKKQVLAPVECALDHAFAVGPEVYEAIRGDLANIGKFMLTTRADVHGEPAAERMQAANVAKSADIDLEGLTVVFLGSVKCCVFDFTPTSERLAEWLYKLAAGLYRDPDGVVVQRARVYETLHPVASFAEFTP